MKRLIGGIILALACATSAHAQRSWFGLVGGGLTFGGDKLATVEYDNDDDDDDDNTERDIRAGNLVYIFTGAEYRFNSVASIQATIGYQIDNASGDNGSVRFTRYPIELLMQFHVSPSIRLGGGVRAPLDAKLWGSGFANGLETRFETPVGGVLQLEYLVTQNIGIKFRGVVERYKSKLSGQAYDGNHIGILGTFYY